ncbi:MAG: ribosome recycling factor [bacterium]|nr:ribosome recycling factor [bacterium]
MSLDITLVENDVKSFQGPMEIEMSKSIKHFEGELIKIRTGRAHTSLIEDIPVSAYGQSAMPLKNLAALSAADTNLLTIQPWDKNTIGDIEKAILKSEVGIKPISDGTIIRLQLPKMSADRREDLLKILSKKSEESKMSVRNIRKDFNNIMRDAKKNKTISENFHNRLSDVLQNVCDDFCKKIDTMAKKKHDEITSI